MFSSDLNLPWFTNHLYTIGIFLIALLVFHFWLIRASPLSSIGWKRVDYIWLSIGLIGLIGAVANARAVVAENLLDYGQGRIEASFNYMKERADFGRSEVICRKFIRSEYSPPPDVFEKRQREFNEQCEWFQSVSKKLNDIKLIKPTPIDHVQSFGKHPFGGEESAYESFYESIDAYNEIVKKIIELKLAKEASGIELIFRLIGPAFIAIALALRITKVTGEIFIERSKK